MMVKRYPLSSVVIRFAIRIRFESSLAKPIISLNLPANVKSMTVFS